MKMLTRNEFHNTRPEIQQLVDEVLLENSRYKRELRSFHREVLVCPVIVTLPDENEDEQHCVSRNISPAGISLISSVEFVDRIMATLDLYRLGKTNKSLIVAECRWCKPFGQKYWMSGWQFLRLQTNR